MPKCASGQLASNVLQRISIACLDNLWNPEILVTPWLEIVLLSCVRKANTKVAKPLVILSDFMREKTWGLYF